MKSRRTVTIPGIPWHVPSFVALTQNGEAKGGSCDLTLTDCEYTWWDLIDPLGPGHSSTTQSVYCNLNAGYTDIPRKLSDLIAWVLVNDLNLFDIPSDVYDRANHPGLVASVGLGNPVRGLNGLVH